MNAVFGKGGNNEFKIYTAAFLFFASDMFIHSAFVFWLMDNVPSFTTNYRTKFCL